MATDRDADRTTDRLIDHQYDGIQEYDNPMPRWWLLTFAGTIVFSGIYLLNVGPVGKGPGRIAEYEAAMAKAAAEHPAPSGGDVSAERLLAVRNDAHEVAEGQKVYAAYCAACHAPDGGGLIGPNLADGYWLHGGTLPAIYATIVNGVLEKGMPPWGKSLKPEQLLEVTAYVASLQGTTPATPKAPQGVPVPPVVPPATP
jgi:cytochrome c oxidase cbb3-type subunit 3